LTSIFTPFMSFLDAELISIHVDIEDSDLFTTLEEGDFRSDPEMCQIGNGLHGYFILINRLFRYYQEKYSEKLV